MVKKETAEPKGTENVKPPEETGDLTPPEGVQPKTYSQEEVNALVVEAETAKGQLQTEVERKETVIQRLQKRKPEEQPRQGDDLFFAKQFLQDKERRAREDQQFDPEIPVLRQELARREAVAQQQRMWQDWQGEIQNQEDVLTKKLEDAGINPGSPEAIPVWESFAMAKQHADFSFANKKADLLIDQAKPKETKGEKKGAKLADLSDEDKEELERQVYEKEGLLKSPTGGPSGGGRTFTREQIENMSQEEYSQNKDEIDKAYKEGRIK